MSKAKNNKLQPEESDIWLFKRPFIWEVRPLIVNNKINPEVSGKVNFKPDNYKRSDLRPNRQNYKITKKFSDDPDKDLYYRMVWTFTESQPIHTLPGYEKRGFKNFHLDHIMPIDFGYKNGLPPEYIGRLSNLRFIPALENMKKGKHYNPVKSKWDYLKK